MISIRPNLLQSRENNLLLQCKSTNVRTANGERQTSNFKLQLDVCGERGSKYRLDFLHFLGSGRVPFSEQRLVIDPRV